MILYIVVFILITVFIAYITLSYMRTPTPSTEQYDLTKSALTTVVPNLTLPWDMKTPSSIRFAVYVTSAPKTMSLVDVCDKGETTACLQQSCNEPKFSNCKCKTSSCSNCRFDIQIDGENSCPAYPNFSKLLWMGSCVNLWVSGYTSQSDKPIVPTLLTIKTGSGSTIHIESISLPAIPLQKWTIVTIAQEGRRIDVYYGEKAVASTFLKYTPVPAYPTDSWMVGGMKGWSGTIGMFSTTRSTYSSENVRQDVEQLIDSTGLPFSLNQLNFSFNFQDFQLPSCILGSCSGLPSIKAPNQFSVYASSIS
jgi:hypothetical protein